jgi:hypothetical protein
MIETSPCTLTDNSSQVVLVQVSSESSHDYQAGRAERVIVQTQEVEIKYEGRRPRVESPMAGYELSELQGGSMKTGQGM